MLERQEDGTLTPECAEKVEAVEMIGATFLSAARSSIFLSRIRDNVSGSVTQTDIVVHAQTLLKLYLHLYPKDE